MTTLNLGDRVPDFSLRDQNGKMFNTEAYRGKKMVIYFYPKDESAVCTKEACAFRDSFAAFTDTGAVVVGINAASEESHKQFATKNRLPFQVLSDPGNKVLKSFGIKPALIFTGRETFIVDENGIVVFKFRAFLNGAAHSEQVLDFLKNGK
jgi:peroxiredoxin Q/BCP